MALFSLRSKAPVEKSAALAALLDGASIEVMPRTAAKIESFRDLLPAGTRVYVAHIEGTPIDERVATARRLTDEGFAAMPHVPARIIPDRATLETWLKRYRDEAGASQALVLAGGMATVAGAFTSSIDLLKTGLFDALGYTRLHVAGHPEGNRDIDRDGGTTEIDKALLWKQAHAANPDAEFAIACGVGPSLAVLQKCALDLSKLLVPFEPTEMLAQIAAYKAANPDSLLERVHLFALGGIKASAEWLGETRQGSGGFSPPPENPPRQRGLSAPFGNPRGYLTHKDGIRGGRP